MKNLFKLTFVSLLFVGPLCAATANKAPSTSMKSKAPADVPMLPDSEAEVIDRDIASSDMNRSPNQDRQEGWIVRQTENGMVKVPAKQYFLPGYPIHYPKLIIRNKPRLFEQLIH